MTDDKPLKTRKPNEKIGLLAESQFFAAAYQLITHTRSHNGEKKSQKMFSMLRNTDSETERCDFCNTWLSRRLVAAITEKPLTTHMTVEVTTTNKNT